jgi:hypothetical protein
MNTPLHKLKIKVPLPITVCLLLSWLAIALVLTGLSGDLQEFQWLLLATLSGALSQAIAIIFGGTVSCQMMSRCSDEPPAVETKNEREQNEQTKIIKH